MKARAVRPGRKSHCINTPNKRRPHFGGARKEPQVPNNTLPRLAHCQYRKQLQLSSKFSPGPPRRKHKHHLDGRRNRAVFTAAAMVKTLRQVMGFRVSNRMLRRRRCAKVWKPSCSTALPWRDQQIDDRLRPYYPASRTGRRPTPKSAAPAHASTGHRLRYRPSAR
jgi:hypothetical protein